MEKSKKCSEPLCNTKRCGHSTFCCKHKNRKQRASNPIGAVYQILKDNAKRRKILFDLSIGWFKNFVLASDYMEKKGRGATSLTIDRKNNLFGYVEGNLEIITKSENSLKFWNSDADRAEYFKTFEGIHVDDGTPMPF